MYIIARVRNACEGRMRRRVFRALLGLDTATFAGKGAYKLNELLAEDARAVGRVLDLVVEASKAMGKILIGLSYLALASPIMVRENYWLQRRRGRGGLTRMRLTHSSP